jgi:renalase
MNKTIAVVGAGISGLLLARDLQARGADVVVLEKSRGVGGRLATKRVGPAVFDQGAQFFTVRDERFRTVVNEWRGAGIATTWPGRETERVIGVAGMTALPKALAASLPFQREHRVTRAMRHASGCWELEIENHGMLRAERLVLTAPVPQSLALLEPGLLAPAVHEALSLLTYHPCLALLLALDGPSAVPPEGFAPSAGAIRWVADNSLKGVSPGPAGALTLHTTPAFAAQHYGESSEALASCRPPSIAGSSASPRPPIRNRLFGFPTWRSASAETPSEDRASRVPPYPAWPSQPASPRPLLAFPRNSPVLRRLFT